LIIPMICSSMKRLFLVRPLLRVGQTLRQIEGASGGQVITDARAEAHYNAAVESWGDRVSAAGVRLCRWFNANGAKFDCR